MPASFSNTHSSESNTLKQQIDKLAALGIALGQPKEELWQTLTEYNGVAYYEEEPYMRLLFELAMEGLSANIWTFDLESAESPDVYEEYITRMIGLAEGRIQISDLHGKFDPAQGSTGISFVHEGTRYELFRDESRRLVRYLCIGKRSKHCARDRPPIPSSCSGSNRYCHFL